MFRAHPQGRLWGLVLVLLLLATTSLSHAQKKDAFSRRDTNSDGVIIQPEWTASGERAIRRLDHDGDGSISRREFLHFQKKWAERLSNRVLQRIEKRGGKAIRLASIRREKRKQHLKMFDANQDELLTKAGLRSGLERTAAGRMERLFKRFDRI